MVKDVLFRSVEKDAKMISIGERSPIGLNFDCNKNRWGFQPRCLLGCGHNFADEWKLLRGDIKRKERSCWVDQIGLLLRAGKNN